MGFEDRPSDCIKCWVKVWAVNHLFLTRISKKTSMSERRLVFSNVRLIFHCFRNCLWGRSHSYIKCLVVLEHAKSVFSMWLCQRTCEEKNFSSRAKEACMFSNVVHVHEHEIFCRVRRTITAFFEVNVVRNNLFKKNFWTLLDERLINFPIWFFVTLRPLIKTWLI